MFLPPVLWVHFTIFSVHTRGFTKCYTMNISFTTFYRLCKKNGIFNANLWFMFGDIFCIKINTQPGICSLKLTASLAYAYCKRTCMQTGRGFPTMVWTIILHFRFCIVLINVWLRKYLIVKLVSVFPTFNNNMVKSSSNRAVKEADPSYRCRFIGN